MVVIKMHNIEHPVWKVIEMSGETASSAADSPRYPCSVLKPFFEWQFEEKKFDFAIIAPSRKSFLPKVFQQRCFFDGLNLIVNLEQAMQSQTDLEKAALRGYELVFATTSSTLTLEKFFNNYGYLCAGHARLGDRSKHDLFSASWNDKKMLQALSFCKRMGAASLCCFAHDAEPVYILS